MKSHSDKDRVKDATSRLELAINDLVASVGDRAADYVERAAERIEQELDQRPPPRRQREPAWLFSDEPRSAKLRRDSANGKILGVCAGLASYTGIERWVVRIIAVTALIFLNWVALVAYLVAGLILEPEDGRRRRRAVPRRHRSRRAERRAARREPAPEPAAPAEYSPGQRLREVREGFDEIELRIRRMETHVTSGNYELQRELRKIGEPGPATP